MKDNLTEKLLQVDSIADSEKEFNKHWSEFTDKENMQCLARNFINNEMKADYLKSLGDTNFKMTWDEFKTIIISYGFHEGISYQFKTIPMYEGDKINTEEAILYYHKVKGLIIFATSYWNMKSVNGGTLYGEVKITNENQNDLYNALKCSHGAFGEYNRKTGKVDLKDSVDFSCDIREGLIHRLNSIDSVAEFENEWKENHFLWFVDFAEEKQEGYDYKKITKDKILKCPQEMQDIVSIYLQDKED